MESGDHGVENWVSFDHLQVTFRVHFVFIEAFVDFSQNSTGPEHEKISSLRFLG